MSSLPYPVVKADGALLVLGRQAGNTSPMANDPRFEAIPALRETISQKWGKHARDVLPLWVADMDFPVAAPIAAALESYVNKGFFGYPLHSYYDDLAGAYCGWAARHYGVNVDPDLVCSLTEVVQGMHALVHVFTEPGDAVLLLTPIYPPFLGVLAEQQRRLVEYRMTVVDGRWSLDLTELRDLVARERPKMFMLCHPHNPVGRVFSADELAGIVAICEEFDVLVVSDEIHADLVFAPHTHVPFASVGGASARTVTITAASKSFNLAGLRCAVMAFGSMALKERFEKMFSSHILGVPPVAGILASITAWTTGDDWMAACLSHLDGNRRYAYEWLLPLGLVSADRAPIIEATYLQWLDFSTVVPESEENVALRLVQEARVALNEGPTFGTGLERNARLNLGTSRSILTEALDRLETWTASQ
jgi:cysteine-S-conjugate beta-lyase